eukprot:scaffold52826_cov52-Attheya_sp.AAC.1
MRMQAKVRHEHHAASKAEAETESAKPPGQLQILMHVIKGCGRSEEPSVQTLAKILELATRQLLHHFDRRISARTKRVACRKCSIYLSSLLRYPTALRIHSQQYARGYLGYYRQRTTPTLSLTPEENDNR